MEAVGFNLDKILFNIRCLTYDFGHLRKHKNSHFASLPGNQFKLLIYCSNYLQNNCQIAIVTLRHSTTHFPGFPSVYAVFWQLHALMRCRFKDSRKGGNKRVTCNQRYPLPSFGHRRRPDSAVGNKQSQGKKQNGPVGNRKATKLQISWGIESYFERSNTNSRRTRRRDCNYSRHKPGSAH